MDFLKKTYSYLLTNGFFDRKQRARINPGEIIIYSGGMSGVVGTGELSEAARTQPGVHLSRSGVQWCPVSGVGGESGRRSFDVPGEEGLNS